MSEQSRVYCSWWPMNQQFLDLLLVLLAFHSSEFGLALLVHGRHQVSFRSFLFSTDYVLAMLCGVLEHLLESYFVPGIKQHFWISNTGLALVVFGELVRKIAILTAWKSFTHDIKTRREEEHTLVTHGVYRLVRHPSYSGFLVWSIGTQVMMCNPFCTVAYGLVVWSFFRSRIRYEEHYLRRFFGAQYEDYMKRVPSGIPFVT